MRTLLVILFAIFLSSCSDRASDTVPSSVSVPDQTRLHETIRAQAEDMQKKAVSGDLNGFISYIHRDVIALAGGPDKLREKMAPELADLAKTIEKTSLGEISEVVDDGGRLVAFVPVETIYRFPIGGLLQKSYRIACSEDGGKTWSFMDGQGREDQEAFFKSKFPVLTKKFPFPRCVHENI